MVEETISVKVLGDYLSVVKSPMYERSYFEPYNPDDLLRKFGGNQGIDKYQKMKTDDAVKAALYVKKAAVMSSGWKIESASQEKEDIGVADSISHLLLNYYDGNFDSSLIEIMSAIEYGFSVTEKIYEIVDNQIILKQLKNRPTGSFEFHTDSFGNLKPDGLKQWTSDRGLIPLPRLKFIIFTHNKEFDNLYGDSDLRAAYRSWFSKDVAIKAYNIYLERCGNPLVYGKYGKTASSDDRGTLQEIIDNISIKTSLLLPEDAEIGFIESTRQGTADFKAAIDLHNQLIMRSVLVPRHLGFDEASGGSYALGKVNFDVFAWVANRLRQELEECVNEQLIRQMAILNWPNIEKFPVFKFNPLTEEDKSQKAKDIIAGLQFGAVSPSVETENYLRGLLGLPELKIEKEPETFKLSCTYQLRRQPNKYEKKVNFAFIQTNLRNKSEEGIDEIKEQLKKVRDDFTTQLVRKRIVEGKNVAGAGSLEFRYIRELGLLVEGVLRQGYEAGKKSAKDTAGKAEFAKPISNIGLIKGKATMWIKEQSKVLTGDISTKLQNKAKQIILDGLSRGAPVNEVVNLIDNAFEPYVAVEGVEGSEIEGMRLFTEVNTAFAQAFANGLREYNQELEGDGWIEAYEYSSILDDVTTEGCEELDKQIYGVANPYLNEIAPPRHYCCRSVLVPIFKGEEWIESEVLDVKREF